MNHRRCIVAVDKSVIERGRQVHHETNLDLTVQYHRTLDRAIHADDRNLGGIDNRR